MKKSRILLVLTLVLALVMAFTACGPSTPTNSTPTQGTTAPTPDDHVCESVCATCGLCTDAECTEAVCVDKCAGHSTGETESTPVLSVVPAEIEINAGDDIDLMFGVTVTDELDEEPKVIIEDDDDFDADVEGVYTITYLAQNKFGNTASATRTVTVNKALSALTLEVQKNKLGENKWKGTVLNFKNQLFVNLTESTTVAKKSGVFHNASSSAITLTVSNSDYAVVAIIDANGVVIEGRDGANNKVVNASNPNRDSSTLKLDDINAVADNMVIPAGGYAIVVQIDYAGVGVDYDGRGFMNYNVIGTYGNVVRLLWADTQEIITPYVDQAPVISGNGTIVYAGIGDAAFVLDSSVLAGVSAIDDNGTFTPDDDASVTVSVKANGGFDISVAGQYTVTLEATDGTHTTTATRVVEVTTEVVEIKIGDNSYKTLPDNIAIDKDITVVGSNLFVIYTPDYEGGLNWNNGWGEAFVLNQYGEVVRIYDGANGKYYDVENPSGIADSTKCTAAGYLKEAYASLADGEYLLVAPNANGNVSRKFLLDNRTVGAKVTLPGITFVHACESVCAQCGLCLDADCTEAACASKCEGHVHNCSAICDVCGKCQNADCTDEVCVAKCDCVTVIVGEKSIKIKAGTIAIDVATPSVGSYNFIVYTYSYKAANATLSWNNGWSEAFILNQYGQVARVYDGVSGGKYFDAEYRTGTTGVTTAANTLADAYASLSEGETLILGANGGMNSNAGRGFLAGVRTIGLIATVPGVTFEELPEHTCESACAKCGKCTDTTCILPACLAQCVCHWCESECATCGGCLDTACTEEDCADKCTCHSCDSYCAICGGCADTACTDDVCATKCVCIMTPESGKYFAINGTYYYTSDVVYNTAVTANTCHNSGTGRIVIYDKNYTGTFTTNSYGVAVVIDATGKLVKGYAWDGYYTASGKAAIHYAVADYATTAFSELEDGEILIIFANDGANGTTSPRTFGKSLCDNWATTMGKQASLTGFTFE